MQGPKNNAKTKKKRASSAQDEYELNEEQTSGRTMKYLEILEMGNYSTTDE
jgi:hypothetical protein